MQSRYYDPELGRFLNADSIFDTANLLGTNQFAYCDNNSVNKVDYSGEDGQYIELGNGWFCRIDAQDTSTGTQRHIHIWNDHKNVSYAQNEDGSPHDKNNNSQGKLPKWLQKKIKDKTGWDYNGKRESFFEQTDILYWVEAIQYTYADGTTIFRQYSRFTLPDYSLNSYESIYFQGEKTYGAESHTTQVYYLPITGSISIPVFSFEISWLPFFIPVLCY